MPRATMKEESAYALPSDTLFDGQLNAVKIKTIEFTLKKDRGLKKQGEKDSFDIWEWEFEVTAGAYKGTRCWGTTESELNNLEEPRSRSKLVRPWAETLLGRQIAIGEDFDTDQICGLPCKFTVTNEEPVERKDGNGFYYGCSVEDVFPSSNSTKEDAPF